MQSSDANAGKASLAELGAIFPQPRRATIAGREIEIVPASIRIGYHVHQLLGELFEKQDPAAPDELVVFDENPVEVLALLDAATGLDRGWLSSLATGDRYDLWCEWMESGNFAFFVWRPIRQRQRMQTIMLGVAMHGVGPTQSTDSMSTGTRIPEATPRKSRESTSKPSSAKTAGNGAIS